MKSYQFSLGDSTDGTVGAVICVVAESPEEALAIVREVLPIEASVSKQLWDEGTGRIERVEYANIYFGWDNVTLDNLDSDNIEPVDEDMIRYYKDRSQYLKEADPGNDVFQCRSCGRADYIEESIQVGDMLCCVECGEIYKQALSRKRI